MISPVSNKLILRPGFSSLADEQKVLINVYSTAFNEQFIFYLVH